MNTEQSINRLLIRFHDLAKKCRKRLEAGKDDSDLREQMDSVKHRIRELETQEKEERISH